jgi:hypothetical protein
VKRRLGTGALRPRGQYAFAPFDAVGLSVLLGTRLAYNAKLAKREIGRVPSLKEGKMLPAFTAPPPDDRIDATDDSTGILARWRGIQCRHWNPLAVNCPCAVHARHFRHS